MNELKAQDKKIVFTNGVFDIIHRGHVEYLTEAKNLGDVLIVGLNSDSSVKMIKGDKNKFMRYWIENQKIINDLDWANLKIQEEEEW